MCLLRLYKETGQKKKEFYKGLAWLLTLMHHVRRNPGNPSPQGFGDPNQN